MPGSTAPSVAAAAQPHSTPISDRLHDLLTGGPDSWAPLLGEASHLLVNLAVGIGLLVLTLWLARWASDLTRDAMSRIQGHGHGHKPDAVLQDFIASLVRYTVVVVGGIAVLQQIGVQTTSVLAVLGGLTLTIGLALQGGLSNVAAGLMILVLRPYRIGDRVVISGVQGVVRGLDLFVTRVHDYDNSVVFIPNSKAFGDVIVNLSMLENRRIVMDFGIDHADDLDLALALLLETAKADPRVVGKPPPWAKVTALNDSTVTVTLRAWTSPDDYADTRFDLIKEVKATFEEAGLSFAYPHQVAVESRPWVAPDKDRQERALAEHHRAQATEPVAANGAPRVNRGTGRSVETE
jgi:small conductance mechanosensitive channel